jgi:hypothetical protein
MIAIGTAHRSRTALRRALGAWLTLAVALAPLAGVAGMAGAAGAASKSSSRSGDDFEWSGKIAAGKAIEIKGINGGIEVEPTTGSEVKVSAEKSAHKSDPESVSIEVIEHDGGVTICAVYPTPKGESPNECQPGKGGHMSTRNNDVEVEFRVQMPAGVRFIGRTVNGDVRASGLKANAEAYTVNGSVKLSTSGTARASTVNGSIDAEMGMPAGDELEFESVNGGITLTMPVSSGANVNASTVNGDISTDFSLTVHGKFGPRSIHGTIGKGGPDLNLNTVNGSIRLRSATS